MPDKDVVKVYVGTDMSHMEKAELALEYSIKKHCSGPYEIIWMDYNRGGIWGGWDIGREVGQPYAKKGWATDFTNFRFAIPEANGFEGRAIYLDVDMILLMDIRKLFETPMDAPILVTPRGYDVMLIDCAAFKDKMWWPLIERMKVNKWNMQDYHHQLMEHQFVARGLSSDWNCLDGADYDPEKTGLIHFTDMNTQPWKPYPKVFNYPPHPRPYAVEIWDKLYQEALQEKEAGDL